MTHRSPADDEVLLHASAAAEAIRAVIGHTQGRPISPALLTYVLGNLQCVVRNLPQLFGQLGDGLHQSYCHDVRDGDPDAEQSVINARAFLVEAAELAREIADRLEAAQGAAALPGHYVRSHEDKA